MAPDKSKKRKRSDSDAAGSDGRKLTLEPSSIPSTQVGPVLGMCAYCLFYDLQDMVCLALDTSRNSSRCWIILDHEICIRCFDIDRFSASTNVQ